MSEKGVVDLKSGEIILSGSEMLKLITDVHKKGGLFRFRAGGYSMKPSVRNNDIITVSPVYKTGLIRGDVVVFQKEKNSQMAVHRIIKKRKGEYLLRGDNSSEPDGWIPIRKIYGVVTGVERNGKNKFWPDRSKNRFFFAPFLYISPFIMNIRKNLVCIIYMLKGKSGQNG